MITQEKGFKRITISFKEYEYLIGVINKEIYIYLRQNVITNN
jgi:hypothetical protein